MMSMSQLTLVNPEPPNVLIFSHPSTLNTILSLNGQPYFKVATVDAAAECTTITNLRTSELIATLKRRTFLPDTVTFPNKYGGQSMKQRDWLVADTLPDGHKLWRMQTSAGSFVWREDEVYRLALSRESDPDQPVAYAQFATVKDRNIPFGLVLLRGTEPLWDEIIASFLILELSLQMLYGVQGAMLTGPRGPYANVVFNPVA